jgi:hypothetical protein
MSYTPDNQLLETPALKAAEAISELQAPVRERLRNPNEWNEAHLSELKELLFELIEMELRLRKLAADHH